MDGVVDVEWLRSGSCLGQRCILLSAGIGVVVVNGWVSVDGRRFHGGLISMAA